MEKETLVHKCRLPVESDEYEVLIYSRPNGTHVAKTVIDVYDVIINDGPTLDAVLEKHCQLLPLAINSRQLLSNSRKDD